MSTFNLDELIAQLDPEDQALLQATSGGDIARLLGVDPSAGRFFSPSEFNIGGLQEQGAEELGFIERGFGQQRGGLLASLAGGTRQIGQRAAASGFARAGAFGRARQALGRQGQQQLGGFQLGRQQDIATSQRGILGSLLSTIGGFRERAAGFEPLGPDDVTTAQQVTTAGFDPTGGGIGGAVGAGVPGGGIQVDPQVASANIDLLKAAGAAGLIPRTAGAPGVVNQLIALRDANPGLSIDEILDLFRGG